MPVTMGQLMVAAVGFNAVLVGIFLYRMKRQTAGFSRLAKRPTGEARQDLGKNRELGEFLIEHGQLTADQLELALQQQQALAEQGRYVGLHQVLLTQKAVSPAQLKQFLPLFKRWQKTKWAQLKQAERR